MASALGLGKLGKHIKDLPTLGVRDFWRQPESSTQAPAILLPQPAFEDEAPLSPRSIQVRDEAKQTVLESLDPLYYEAGFQGVPHELSILGMAVNSEQLEEVAEARTAVLDVLGEILSQHILQNYASFVKGIDSVTTIEEELRTALDTVAAGRATLAHLKELSNTDVLIAEGALRKRRIASVLDALQKLKNTQELPTALREAQDSGEFSQAFLLCAQSCHWMSELHKVHVAAPLTASVNGHYEETTRGLEAALQALCADFKPATVSKILEGYIFLGNVGHLGGEVTVAFTNALDAATLAAVRMTIVAHFGGPERAKGVNSLQEAIKGMPAHVLRMCLAKVLTATFEVLSSHQRMRAWAEESLLRHSTDLSTLQSLRASCRMRLSSLGGSVSLPPLESALSLSDPNTPTGRAATPSAPPSSPQPALQQPVPTQADWAPMTPSPTRGSLVNKFRLPADHSHGHAADSPKGVIKAHGSVQSTAQRSQSGDSACQLEQSQHLIMAELQDAEWNEQGEVAWGDVLKVVANGLISSCNFLWEEASGKLSILFGSSTIFSGDHFLMVVQWAQAAIEMGETFCGSAQALVGFRSLVTSQTRAAFNQLHAANLDSLYSMLDREMWRSVPLPHTPADGDLGGMLRGPADLLGLGGESLSSSPSAGAQHSQPWRDYKMEASTSASRPDANASAPSRPSTFQAGSGEGSRTSSQQKGPAMALSAVRLLRWVREYGELVRVLRPAPMILAGIFEMFEMLLVSTFVAFSDVTLSSLLDDTASKVPADISRRLHRTLRRIANESLVKYRAQLTSSQNRASSSSITAGSNALMQQLKMRGSIASLADAKPQGPGAPQPTPMDALQSPSRVPPTALSFTAFQGNLWGLMERSTAVDSLTAAAKELQNARSDMLAYVPTADHPVVENFFAHTVQSAEDVSECILKAGIKVALPLGPTTQRIAAVDYNLDEPAEQASEWVDDLCNHLATFRDRLSQANGLAESTVSQLWRHAITATGEAMLEGFARVKGRCSAIGRNTMSADLQEAVHTIRSLAPASPETTAALGASMRLCDTYIKAFFLPTEAEVQRWAQTHPEYSMAQHLALAGAIADSKAMKKKDRAVFLAVMESLLSDGHG